MPPGYRRYGIILRLDKALYRLRKSPLLWQCELIGAFKRLGFKPVLYKPYYLILDGILIFFYINDIVFAFSHRIANKAQGLVKKLKS